MTILKINFATYFAHDNYLLEHKIFKENIYDLPFFIQIILFSLSVNLKGKYDFIYMFLIPYIYGTEQISRDEFRKDVKNHVFLFIDGYYMGIYKNTDHAINYAIEENRYNDKHLIFIQPMVTKAFKSYTNILYSREYHNKMPCNDIIICNELYSISASIGNINDGDIIPETIFLIDSGNSITTLPYSHLIDHKTFKYDVKNIKDMDLKRRLLKFNKQILRGCIYATEYANGQLSTQTYIFLKNNTTITLDGVHHIYARILSFPSMLIHEVKKCDSFYLMIINLFKFDKNNLPKYIAVKNHPQLLGCDSIEQLYLEKEIIDPYCNKLTIKK